MKYIKFIFKLLFYPISLLNNLIYGSPPINVAYSWYTKENFMKMVEHAKDDADNLIQSYNEWKENADQRIENMKSINMRVYRVNINYDEMAIWFGNNNLENTVENREAYVDYKFQDFMKDPIIK
ncbi:MAG: hypothetical protein HON27_05000 [Candidatus Marinimicrobia bacterium]|jgi:hypothetical protein|nr:hypothetical protein [Candidatus Neomarinimicrobiota bacterium]